MKLEKTYVGPMWLLEDRQGIVSGVSRAVRRGGYEKASLDLLGNYLQPNMIGLDVGANIGVYSVFVSQRIGNGTVYAFEPHPELYSVLAKNAELYKNIHSFNFGLWNKCSGSLLGYLDGYTNTKYTFEVLIGDDILQNVEKVDFIKIDVDGAEVGVLKGLQNLIKKSLKLFVIIELYNEGLNRFGSSMEEFFTLIESLGFEYGRIISKNTIDLKNDKEKLMKLYTKKSYCNLLLYKGIKPFWEEK